MTVDGKVQARSDKLSVAFVSPAWPPNAIANGIVPYVANIADRMRANGHSATIVAQRVVGEEASAWVRDAFPAKFSRNPAARAVDSLIHRVSPSLSERRHAVRALVSVCRSLVEEEGVQLVELEESFGWAWWLRRALTVPVVVRLHGPWFLNGPLRGAVDDEAFRRRCRIEGKAIEEAEAITAPSLDVLEQTRAFYNLPLERARVIPAPTTMFAPEDRWSERASEPETIVFVGRFDRHKGGDLVIDAFAEVVRRRPGARLLFAGPDAGYRDEAGRPWTIQEYIQDRLPDPGIAARVQWLGPQPGASLPGLRKRGAVVVVGSRYDNFPLTVVEAMAVGAPLVAPAVGGIPEMVTDGVNGLLYKAGDASDMAAKLLKALEDRELASRIGARAGVDCERRYHPEALAREIADYFRGVIDARAGRGRGASGP